MKNVIIYLFVVYFSNNKQSFSMYILQMHQLFLLYEKIIELQFCMILF